jgi:hypothetical protein
MILKCKKSGAETLNLFLLAYLRIVEGNFNEGDVIINEIYKKHKGKKYIPP